MDLSKPILVTSSTPKLDEILDSIVYVHAHCILHDHTMATFLPPLSHGAMLASWRGWLTEVDAKNRHIMVQLMPVDSRTANIASPSFTDMSADTVTSNVVLPREGEDVSYEVAGVVSLEKPVTETGAFRGVVGRLFTSPNHRRKGVARAVMRKLEEMAMQDGRWNIMLDTTVGTEAESVYPRLGYTRLGVVQEYGYRPNDRSLADEVWFWKDLRKTEPL